VLTKEVVERAVPANLKSSITQQLVDRINTAVGDPIIAEQVRENFLNYTSVLRDGKFKTEDYLHAVMYVSFKLLGDSNLIAYTKTFPQRYTDLISKGTSSKDIAAYVAAYNKGKLVNLVFEQSAVPSWVLNQHIYQEAINTQYDLMTTAASEKVRTEAANSLLTHLKRPEAIKASIDVTLKDSSGMTEMKEAMRQMALQQQQLIQNGASARQIADMSIIEAEFEEVPNEA
jgi:hypothetical protein